MKKGKDLISGVYQQQQHPPLRQAEEIWKMFFLSASFLPSQAREFNYFMFFSQPTQASFRTHKTEAPTSDEVHFSCIQMVL